ncbi:MAG: MFS transporter [Actinomycetia bacterium]|nr:MFS transporter [Actinomycetes bacterium]
MGLGVEREAVPSRPRTAIRWWIFVLLLVIVTANYIDRSSISVALPLMTKQYHLSPLVSGLVLSAFFWTYAAMQLPSGWMADRLKPRLLTAGSTIGWGVVEALTALASSAGVLVLLRLLLGVFEGPVYPAGAKLNAVWLTAAERGRGGTLLDAGAPLGTAIGGVVIVGLIGLLGSWQAAFVAAGVITVVLGLVAAWFIRNAPAEHPLVSPEEVRYLEAAHAAEDAAVKGSAGRGNLFKYMRFKSFWTMCLGWLGFDVVFYGLLSWVPYYLTTFRHIPFSVSGVSVFLIFGMGFVGELIGGQLADRWRLAGGRPNVVMRTLLGVAGVVTTAAVVVVAFTASAVAAVALLAVVLFFLRWAGLYWSVPSLLTDQEHAGLLGGAMNFAGNVGGIIAPVAVGAILNATHSFFLALMMFAAAGLLWTVSSLLMDYSRKLPVEG